MTHIFTISEDKGQALSHQYGAGLLYRSGEDRRMQNRIRELREAAGLTQEDLASRIGTASQQISRLEKGERKLTVEWMMKLGPALGVSPAALLADGLTLGGAALTPSAPKPASAALAQPPANEIEFAGQSYIPLPVYDVNVSAGPGSINSENPEPERWTLFDQHQLLGLTRSKAEFLAIVRVSGDSMAPTLQHGDLILVDRSIRTVGRDGLYIIAAGYEVQVKRVTRDWGEQRLTVSSDNAAYPPSKGVQEDGLVILGRAVWISRNVGG